MQDLFDTQDKINMASASFKTLKDHAGWQLLVQIVKGNMEVLRKQILDGEDNGVKLTETELDRKRDKLKAYEEVIGTPDLWIDRFNAPEQIIPTEDPYYTTESYQKETKPN